MIAQERKQAPLTKVSISFAATSHIRKINSIQIIFEFEIQKKNFDLQSLTESCNFINQEIGPDQFNLKSQYRQSTSENHELTG